MGEYTKSSNYQRLLMELINIYSDLNKLKIEYRLGGSFAINLYADREMIESQDLDFVCEGKAAHDRLIDTLISTHAYTQTEQESWKNETNEENVNTKLSSTDGILVEVAFTNDISLTNEAKKIVIQGCPVQAFTLHDLKTIYTKFAHRKAGGQRKLDLINELIEESVT